MIKESPHALARRLERTITTVLSHVDAYSLDTKPRQVVMTLKRRAGEIRLDTRDYEYAESRTTQLAHARAARKQLQQLRTDIVTASEYGIFSPVDVVQLSTWIDSLFDQIV